MRYNELDELTKKIVEDCTQSEDLIEVEKDEIPEGIIGCARNLAEEMLGLMTLKTLKTLKPAVTEDEDDSDEAASKIRKAKEKTKDTDEASMDDKGASVAEDSQNKLRKNNPMSHSIHGKTLHRDASWEHGEHRGSFQSGVHRDASGNDTKHRGTLSSPQQKMLSQLKDKGFTANIDTGGNVGHKQSGASSSYRAEPHHKPVHLHVSGKAVRRGHSSSHGGKSYDSAYDKGGAFVHKGATPHQMKKLSGMHDSDSMHTITIHPDGRTDYGHKSS